MPARSRIAVASRSPQSSSKSSHQNTSSAGAPPATHPHSKVAWHYGLGDQQDYFDRQRDKVRKQTLRFNPASKVHEDLEENLRPAEYATVAAVMSRIQNNRPKAVMSVLMTQEDAAIAIQRKWKRVLKRRNRKELNMDARLHLGYERKIINLRIGRRRMLFQFFQHLMYMLLLIWVVMMQGGSSVSKKNEIVHAISEHLYSLKTLECAALTLTPTLTLTLNPDPDPNPGALKTLECAALTLTLP
jgi:hypothetical protein